MTEGTRQALTGYDDQAAAAQAAGSAAQPLPRRIPAHTVTAMLATASRAPSVHNTQPWRFAVGPHAIDLYADPERRLGQDRDGREMLISCGAALFGLRLAVRGPGTAPHPGPRGRRVGGGQPANPAAGDLGDPGPHPHQARAARNAADAAPVRARAHQPGLRAPHSP
jgi:nitroreductase